MANILLIEPNPVLARTYEQILQHSGHAVTSVTSAQSAVEAADQSKPDVIVLELQLPVHGGVEFLYELRSYDEWQQIPVVLHTYTPAQKLAPVQDVLQKTLGVRAFLYKPQTSLQQLVQTVRDVAGITA
jgi:CheY-like chemotaxis protein